MDHHQRSGKLHNENHSPLFFSDDEWSEIGDACERIAHAFGYGPTWRCPTIEGPATKDGDVTDHSLDIIHRGYKMEGAARGIGGSTSSRQQHTWAKHAGIVCMPVSSPDVYGLIAISMSAPPLLKGFALETPCDLRAALAAEGCVDGLELTAGHDALVRIMFGRRYFQTRPHLRLDSRAKQFRLRASAYRFMVRKIERRLRTKLLDMARGLNRTLREDAGTTTPFYGSATVKLRTQTFWHPKRAGISKTVRTFVGELAIAHCRRYPAQPSLYARPIENGTAKHPANGIQGEGVKVGEAQYDSGAQPSSAQVFGNFFQGLNHESM